MHRSCTPAFSSSGRAWSKGGLKGSYPGKLLGFMALMAGVLLVYGYLGDPVSLRPPQDSDHRWGAEAVAPAIATVYPFSII